MIVYNHTYVNQEISYDILLKSFRKQIVTKAYYALAVLVVGGLIFGLSFTAGDSKLMYQILGYVMFGLSVALIGWVIFQYQMAPDKVEKTNKASYENGINYSYRFRETYMQVECKNNGKTNKVDYDYKKVRKVFEYNDYFEIRLKDSSIVIVDKKGFENSRMISYFISNLSKSKVKFINKLDSVNEEKKDV